MKSGSVVRDRVGIARVGHPAAPYPFLGSFLELFDQPRHRIYFYGKSDGFGELLPDMIERDPGPSFAMGSA